MTIYKQTTLRNTMAKNIPWDQSYSKTGAGKAQRRARFGLSPSCEDFGFGGEESVVMADIKGFWANSEEKWRAQRRQWGKRHFMAKERLQKTLTNTYALTRPLKMEDPSETPNLERKARNEALPSGLVSTSAT
nr:hypothetical protein Iba_chr07eCG6570 [Ipomoea batatas]